MGTTVRADAPAAVESILVTGNSTVEHLAAAHSHLDSIEGCLFGEPVSSPPTEAREGIEARSAQAAQLAYDLSERLSRIYNRI